MDLHAFRQLERELVVGGHLTVGSRKIPVAPHSFPSTEELISTLKSERASLDCWLLCFVLLSRMRRSEDVEALGKELQKRGSSGREEDMYHHILTLVAGYCAVNGREEFATKILSVLGRHMDHDAPPVFLVYQKFLEMIQGQEVEVGGVEGEFSQLLPSVLLQGCVAYHAERYADALGHFARALRIKPDGPPTLRFSLGMCYSKMGKEELARKCFQRTLALDPSHVDSMLALAVLDLNAKNIRQGMQHVQAAYRADPQNSRALNFLADHFLVRSRYDKAEELAQKALNGSPVAHIKAESLNLLGRAAHAQGDLAGAESFYSRSLEQASDYMMSRYGLGQLHLAAGRRAEALECFRAVVDRHPDDFYTLKLVGLLAARAGDSKEAITFLQRAIDVSADDQETLYEFAGLVEKTDPQRSVRALRASLKAATRDEDVSEHTIRALRNNVGVMLFTLKMYDEALQYFEAIVDVDNITEECVTVAFNMARTMEELCQVEEAVRVYKALLALHPTYIDCYLRLGIIEKVRGNVKGAANYFQDALVVREDHASAWALLGNLHMSSMEFFAAQKKFEELQRHLPRDTYAQMSLGNIYFQASFQGGDRERSARQKKYALDAYYTVLMRAPSNAYAANGIGCVLADEGRLDAATKIFQSVQEGAQDMPDVLVNLAHTYFARAHYQKAITLYKNALRHFSNRHPKLILYLSAALFQAEEYDESARELQRAIHLWPNKPSLWFNLAVIRETPAKAAVAAAAKAALGIERIQSCQTSLQEALRLYTWLAEDCESADVKKRAAHRITRCGEIAEGLAQAHEVAIAKKEQQERKRRILEQRKIERLQAAELKRKREEQERLKREEEHEAILDDDRRRLEEQAASWKMRAASSSSRKRGGSKKRKNETSRAEREMLEQMEADEAEALVYDSKTDVVIGGEDDEGVLSAPAELEEWQLDLQRNPEMVALIQNKKRREDERRGIQRKARAPEETETELPSSKKKKRKRIKRVQEDAQGEDEEKGEEEDDDLDLELE